MGSPLHEAKTQPKLVLSIHLSFFLLLQAYPIQVSLQGNHIVSFYQCKATFAGAIALCHRRVR